MSVQINVAANQAALMASIQAGVQAYNQRFANNNQLNLNINARAFSQPLGRITGDVKDFEAALAASNARVIAFGASTAVLGTVLRSFKELAVATIEVEKNLTDINRVFGLTTSQLQKFSTELFNVSKTTATSFNEASKAALEFSRQGLKAEDTLQRTKDALTLTRLAGISTANAVDALTSTINGFATTGVTTTQVLNKLVAVEQDYAVGAGDLAEALSRTGQAAQEAGVSLDQLNALVTAAQQSTARGGAVIGNALKTIFTRLQRSETLDQLELFNVSVRDIQGNILPAVQILQNFAGAYKNLADAQRAQLSEQVAGVYQVNILKAIINDLNNSQGVYVGALQRGASATNEAEVATAKLNKTLDALLSQTGIATQQLANNIGKVTFEPLAKYGAEQLKSFVEGMNDLLEGEGIGSTFANGFLKGIRNIIAGPGAIAAFFTLFKLIQNSFSYLTQALPQIAGITTESQNRKNIEASILQILQQQGPIAQALVGATGNQAAQAQLLLQLARQQTAEYQQQAALAKNLATTLSSQGVAVKGGRGLQVTRAGGYIPSSTKMAEAVGAKAGGYSPGRVVNSPVGGVMNTAEDVKYIPGFAQPFINPPANSKAGRAHRQNAINRTGVDPYMSNGFIPNFADSVVASIEKIKDGDTISALPVDPIVTDFRLAGVDAPEEGQKFYNEARNLLEARYSGDSGLNLLNTNANKRKAAYYRGLFSDPPIAKELVEKGLAVPDLRYTRDKSLLDTALKYYDNTIKAGSSAAVNPGLWAYIRHPKFQQYIHQFGLLEGKNIEYKNAVAGEKIIKDTDLYKQLRYKKTKESFDFSGFIPNFAPPTSAIRVPWFKKFGNPAFDNIQPALGISKASDLDTFRQVNFRSSAKNADKVGDNNIFAPLYEDFVFKAMQLVSQPNIKDQLIRGYALQPGTDQKQSAFDAFLGDVALEYKGFPKANLTGSISGNLNDKYERFAKANPSGASKIKESIITFNELGHENQMPSAFGKTFSQLAGTSYSQMVKNSPALVKGLSAETNNLLNSYVKNPAFLAMAAASGFIPNFAGKQVNTRVYRTKTGFGNVFSGEEGTGLSGTVYRQRGTKSYGYQLKEQLNNMVMSILGNNVFMPDPSSVDPRFTDDINASAERSAKIAALRLSSGGKTASLGMEKGMMSEAFGNSRLMFNSGSVYSLEAFGKMHRINYDRLSDVLEVFWSSKPETKAAWDFLKNLSESGKYEDKENIRPKTALLKKAYNDWLTKNQYIGTRVKLSDYRQGAEGVRGANYAALRSDLAGVSNVQNLGEMEKLQKYKDQGVFYGDYKNNKAMYDKMGRWTYNAASKKMFLNSALGFIPNFAYKQAVMSLEEGMSGQKAIFDTKPFPHIRNSSQPTFSSAIADHGGLSNALSDSMRGQKAAGLMSRGFVPNFAPTGTYTYRGRNNIVDPTSGMSQYSTSLGVNLADQERRARTEFQRIINALRTGAMNAQQATDAFNTLNTQAGLSATAQTNLTRILQRNIRTAQQNPTVAPQKQSIATRILGNRRGGSLDRMVQSRIGGVAGVLGGSMLGGQLENLIQGGRERYQLSAAEKFGASASSGVLTAATTGAEIGAFIPALGPAAGAAIGGLIGLGKAAFDAQETIDDMQKASEHFASMASKTTEITQSYIQQISNLATISDPTEKNIASYKLQETFDEINKVSPELGKKFINAGNDILVMQEAVKDFVKTIQDVSSIKRVKANLAALNLEGGDIKKMEKALGKQGYDTKTSLLSGSLTSFVSIKETDASLGAAFKQFNGFFDVIRRSGMEADKAQQFMIEISDELSSVIVSESKLRDIGIKFGLAEDLATELASFLDNVASELPVVGKYFVKFAPKMMKMMFEKQLQTISQQAETAAFNARPYLQKIQDGISKFVLDAALQIQTLEFDKNRLKLLQDASSEYLDSIITPTQKAAREAAMKSQDLQLKFQSERTKLTSDITEGLKGAPKILGSSDIEAITKVEDIIKNIGSSDLSQQLSIVEQLITNTKDIDAAKAAKFKVDDPKALESLNESLRNFRKNIITLNQSEKENSQLLNLEIELNKRRAESTQKLLKIQNELISSDNKRSIAISSERAKIDIRENALQNIRKTPGFGFGISESEITRQTINQNRQLMIDRQNQTRKTIIRNAQSQLKSTFSPILDSIESAYETIQKSAVSEQPDLYKQYKMDDLDISKIYDLQNLIDKINDKSSLEELKTSLEGVLNTLNPQQTPTFFKAVEDQIKAISETLIDLNKESTIFESNASTELKIADVNDKINASYISRLNILLDIEKAQRGVLNSLEIQEQILDAERSRPANFYGLGVTGKAEQQIIYDQRALDIRKQRTSAQAAQNVQAQLNQFETFRATVGAQGLGSKSFGFPASLDKMNEARTAIMNLDTKKITNIDEAKKFADELSRIRTEYNLQGDAAKTLADSEAQIRGILSSNVDELQKMDRIQEILNKKVRQEAIDRQSIRMGLKEGFDLIQEDADTGLNRLAKETPILFRDGMVDAIKATIRETDNLNDALMGIAAKFLDTFSTELMKTGMSKIISGSGLGSLFGAQTGGLIRAQSGMYISGTGSGDKYPAMLENGEYVLNRNAVMAMGGPIALDRLNFSTAPRFAAGGQFKNQFDDISSMEANMTEIGLENSPLYKELNDAAKQKAEEDRRKRFAEKQQRAAMIGSLVAAAATMAIGAGISNISENMQAKDAKSFTEKINAQGGIKTEAEFLKQQKLVKQGLMTPSSPLSAASYIGGTPQTGFKSMFSGPAIGQTWYQKFGSGLSKPFRRQTGGLIGSRLSDTIPGYMEGGLYNTPIVNRYARGMQNGGSSIMSAGNNSSTVNNNTSANNSFNFNTTIQRDGTIQMGSNSTSYEQQDVELSKNLNNRIYAAVGEVIRKEKQFGGSLAGVRS